MIQDQQDFALTAHDWARALFHTKYLPIARSLLEPINDLFHVTCGIYLDGQRVLRLPESGPNPSAFCAALHATVHGSAHCHADHSQRASASHLGAVRVSRCHMGLYNFTYAFRLIGLGLVTVICGSTLHHRRDRYARTENALLAATGEWLTQEEAASLQSVAVGQHPSSAIATPRRLKRHFASACRAIQELLTAAITNHVVFENTLHEVSIYLTAIQGSADYIIAATDRPGWQSKPATVHRIGQDAEVVAAGAAFGLSQTHNLLRFFSVNRGVIGKVSAIARPRLEPLVLADELDYVNRLWSGLAGRKRITVSVTCDLIERVIADASMLRQCLFNMMSNAVKYSFAGSSTRRFVAIVARLHDPGFRSQRVRIRVSNYGLGIPEAEHKLVGTLGYRSEQAQKEHPIGYGIGAYVVRELAQAMHGEFSFSARYLHDSERQTNRGLEMTRVYKVDADLILPIEGH